MNHQHRNPDASPTFGQGVWSFFTRRPVTWRSALDGVGFLGLVGAAAGVVAATRVVRRRAAG